MALLAAALVGAPTLAAAAAPMNRAGFWTLEAKDGASCLATLKVKGGASFLLLGTAGHLAFGALTDQPMARGQRGVIATEAYSFDFKPLYGDKGRFLYTMQDLDVREQAALRLARVVKLSVDGQPLLEAPVEATGLDGVLDDLVACSKGEAGWWGKGAPGLGPAKAAEPAQAPAPAPAVATGPERVFNKEGFWSVAPDGQPGVCTAMARQEDDQGVVLVASGRDIGFGVGWPKAMPQGRKGVLEADGLRFVFTPKYDGDRYFTADKLLDTQTLFVLRRAKGLTITVDGREMLSMQLEGTGLDGAMTALQACARGESGWWGKGATPR